MEILTQLWYQLDRNMKQSQMQEAGLFFNPRQKGWFTRGAGIVEMLE